MTTAVGLWIGAATSTAAIVREDASEQSAPEFVERATVLYTSEDGTTTLGVDPDVPLARTATDFVDRIGDPDGIVLDDGIAYRAEDLLATAVFCLLDGFPEDFSPDDAALALAHPQDWTSDKVAAVIESLNYLGLRGVSLVPVDVPVDAGYAAPASSGHTPAHLAALAALAAAPVVGDAATEQFAAIPKPEIPTLASLTMVDAPAYSAVTDPIPTPPVPMSTQTVVPAARPAPRRRGRAPIVVAVGAAAAFALVGGAIAVAMSEHSQTAVPPITNAEAPPPTTPMTSATPAAPIAFPTVPTTVEQYVAPPVVEVAQVATTTAPPPPVETPPPPVETTPPPATTEAPTATEPPPTTTDPTTTEPTATEPTATEPTTTTTEPAADGRVQSGTVYTGPLQPTLLDEMPEFDDYSGGGGYPDYYPPARPYRNDAG
ncbi:MAG TPA: hypothetical protein VIW24_08875 [Aldersonia sp.]